MDNDLKLTKLKLNVIRLSFLRAGMIIIGPDRPE